MDGWMDTLEVHLKAASLAASLVVVNDINQSCARATSAKTIFLIVNSFVRHAHTQTHTQVEMTFSIGAVFVLTIHVAPTNQPTQEPLHHFFLSIIIILFLLPLSIFYLKVS